MKKARKASDIIAELFRDRFGPDFLEEARLSANLFSTWDIILTELWPQDDKLPVAAHSRIKELERGVLFVEADHPGWIQILQTRQGELLSALQHRFPELEIKSITFKLSRKS